MKGDWLTAFLEGNGEGSMVKRDREIINQRKENRLTNRIKHKLWKWKQIGRWLEWKVRTHHFSEKKLVS